MVESNQNLEICPICNKRPAFAGYIKRRYEKYWTCKACAESKKMTPAEYNTLLIKHFNQKQKDLFKN